MSCINNLHFGNFLLEYQQLNRSLSYYRKLKENSKVLITIYRIFFQRQSTGFIHLFKTSFDIIKKNNYFYIFNY